MGGSREKRKVLTPADPILSARPKVAAPLRQGGHRSGLLDRVGDPVLGCLSSHSSSSRQDGLVSHMGTGKFCEPVRTSSAWEGNPWDDCIQPTGIPTMRATDGWGIPLVA